MIVFTLPLENAEEEYNAFREYIYKYCDSKKERNFIEILAWILQTFKRSHPPPH